MNTKRLLLTIVAVFVGLFATDFLVHQIWLAADYGASKELWRPEADMKKFFGFLVLGQLLIAITFVVIWSKGFPATSSFCGTCFYGLFMGLFGQATTLIWYAVQPLPGTIAVKWFIAGLAQGVLMGAIAYLVGRPKPASPSGAATN